MVKKADIAVPPGFIRSSEVITELEEAARDHRALVSVAQRSLYEKLEREFKANDGCSTCRGRGWIVVWDTMDSPSGCYAEYGNCTNPKCTLASRKKSGLHPHMTKYDFALDVRSPMLDDSMQNIIKLHMTEAQRYVEQVNRMRNVNKNDDVIIVKGRHNVGTSGRVFWKGMSQYGFRIGLNTADGKTVWDYEKNADKLLTLAQAEEFLK
jgi:hypothetical protein